MSRPPAMVIVKDRKPPSSAAASAGTINSVRPVTVRPAMFTISTAPTTARMLPSDQFTVAMRSGEMPCAAVMRRLDATAVVARPNFVER